MSPIRLASALVLIISTLANAQQEKHFSISDFGAVADGKTINSAAIQKAIDQAAAAGGGIVEIPAGTWRSGSIFLKSGVDLNLAENAVLLGSTNIEDCPKRETRIEGHFEPWRMALVNAQQTDRVRIGGKGIWMAMASLFGRSSGRGGGKTPNALTSRLSARG